MLRVGIAAFGPATTLMCRTGTPMGLPVKPSVAQHQLKAERWARSPAGAARDGGPKVTRAGAETAGTSSKSAKASPNAVPRLGLLDEAKVGRDTGRIAEEALSDLPRLAGAVALSP